ncbi:MAG: bifunctional DNA primase/polymerase [Planctomycetota bacterium]
MSTRQEIFEAAERYASARISVIPIRLDGSKAPAILSWKPYQERIAADYETREWFLRSDNAIGIVCGHIKVCTEITPPDPGIEIIDFDAGELFAPWREMVSSIVDRLPVVATPSGGWHVFYRCFEVCGNSKIAMDPTREKKTLIETRGNGGYVVGVGSPGAAHATGNQYALHSGPPVHDMPAISPNERRELWKAARTFNKDKEVIPKAIKRIERSQLPARNATNGDPIISEFNSRFRIGPILESQGWRSRDGIAWTRPGKAFGTSAKIVEASDGTELVRCFSSTPGLPMGSMNAFELCKHVYFGGDGKRAYRAAAERIGQ